MNAHEWIIASIGFLSEFIGTLSGFGSSTFFVPTAVFFEKIQLVLALTALLHCFGNSTKIFLFWGHLKKKQIMELALPSILLSGFGAWLTKYFSVGEFNFGLGILLMILSLFSFFRNLRMLQLSSRLQILLSGLSGLLTGLFGTGGALRGFALSTMSLEKSSFVALSSSIDIGGDLIRAAIYLSQGYMDWSEWQYLPMLALAAIFGANLGKRALKLISQVHFEKIVAVFIFVSGMLLIFKSEV